MRASVISPSSRKSLIGRRPASSARRQLLYQWLYTAHVSCCINGCTLHCTDPTRAIDENERNLHARCCLAAATLSSCSLSNCTSRPLPLAIYRAPYPYLQNFRRIAISTSLHWAIYIYHWIRSILGVAISSLLITDDDRACTCSGAVVVVRRRCRRRHAEPAAAGVPVPPDGRGAHPPLPPQARRRRAVSGARHRRGRHLQVRPVGPARFFHIYASFISPFSCLIMDRVY
jgi:hypothetical protein